MLCLIARLDRDSTERLDRLRSSACASPRPLHGHITVAAYTGDNGEAFTAACRELAAGFPAFDVRYSRIEVLEETSIIVAIPEISEPFRMLQQRVSERFGDSLDRWTVGSAWTPHTTLIYDPDADLHALCRKISEQFSPFTAQISTLEFSRVLDRGYETAGSILLR